MPTKDGGQNTMVIGGKTFNLAGLISESVLDMQMANVFKVLKKLSSLIDTQAGQIQSLQNKVLEIDPLAQRISSMHAWQETTADRLNRIEEKLTIEAKEIAAVTVRVSDLEEKFVIIGQVQDAMKDTNEHMRKVTDDFAQLRLDSRDALQLSKEVKHFKTELQELQEDVTTVLHQAPATERLISQVQQNVEASTEQLQAMDNKTKGMEASMSRMSQTVAEFTHMREDLTRRLTQLENPKVDRLGVLETQSRAMAKQVSVLQHNWMTNWGAHEQSMQVLKDEMLLRIKQAEMGGDSRGAGVAGADGSSGNLTFVRMDEEEKQALRKQIEQCHRDINRIDNKKADYGLVMKSLDDKADTGMLDKKVDVFEFERRLGDLKSAVDNMLASQDVALMTRYSSVRPSTADSVGSGHGYGQIHLNTISEPDLYRNGVEDDVLRQGVDEYASEIDRTGSHPQLVNRPSSTPPILPGSMGGVERGQSGRGSKTTVRYTSSGHQVTYDSAGNTVAHRRLIPAQTSKHSAVNVRPQSRQSRPTPGKIRPATASGLPGSPQIYLLSSSDPAKNKRQAVQPDPSLSLTAHSIKPLLDPRALAGAEDHIQVSNWETFNSPGVSPMPRIGTATSSIPVLPLSSRSGADSDIGAVAPGEVPPHA